VDTNIADAGIGHNNPPEAIEIFRADLREKHADMIRLADTLLSMADRLPAEMDEEWEAKISDAVKKCNAFVKESEAQRLAAARPYRDMISAIDGLFHGMSGPVDKLKTRMNVHYLTPYKDEKAAAEKRRREEEARIAREKAAEEARRAAEEARLVREAKEREEAAKREAERIKREAAEAKERREREAREAAEKAERDRLAAIKAEEEATNKRKRAAAEKVRLEVERQEKERQAKAAEEARAQRDKDRAEKAEAARIEAAAKAERREQERAAAEARDAAAAAQRQSDKAGRLERANAAELSRSRSDLGAVSSLRTTWTFEVDEPSLVPREYLEVNGGAIDRAIKASTYEGKCDLAIPGVRIFPMRDTVTR
jgi:hypothetical protein